MPKTITLTRPEENVVFEALRDYRLRLGRAFRDRVARDGTSDTERHDWLLDKANACHRVEEALSNAKEE